MQQQQFHSEYLQPSVMQPVGPYMPPQQLIPPQPTRPATAPVGPGIVQPKALQKAAADDAAAYATLMAVSGLPAGLTEGLLHYVQGDAILSRTRAGIVGVVAASAAVGAVYASRAVSKRQAGPSAQELLTVAVSAMIAAAQTSAIVSRLDMGAQTGLVSGSLVAFVTASATAGGKMLAAAAAK